MRTHLLFRITLTLAFAAMIATAGADLAQAYSSSPPNSRTGAPGEGNCTQCHSTYPLDSGSGYLYEATTLEVPEYVPEQAYILWIEVADELASRWGFEITLIDDTGEQAGVLTPMDDDAQVSTATVGSNTRQYLKHTSAGTFAGSSDGWVSWAATWFAPAAGTGTVTLYGMGNAANNNNASSGDRIYSYQIMLSEAATDAGTPAMFAAMKPNFPNPFNPKTRIDYSLEREADVRLSIYDATGRLVKVLFEGNLPAGEHGQEWNGVDAGGNASASGTYFARLQAANGQDLDAPRKMTLIK